MTELAIRDSAPLAPIVSYQSAAVERLSDWARSADAAFHVCERLVQSSFVPASFARKPMEATAAVLAGAEIGLSPMASLRAFDVIQGQAAPRAITLRAVVQSFGHEIELIESTATRCRMRGRRRDSQTWQAVTWTMDRARDLGLTGKDNWKKQPQAMLIARATSELARLIAADAILGIGYTSEEIRDGLDTVNDAVAGPPPEDGAHPPQPTGTKRMGRRSTVAPAEPDPTPQPLAAGSITDAQMRKMQALFTEKGFRDSDDRHAYVKDVVGIEVASSRDLTKEQASRVIDSLGLLDVEPPVEAEVDNG